MKYGFSSDMAMYEGIFFLHLNGRFDEAKDMFNDLPKVEKKKLIKVFLPNSAWGISKVAKEEAFNYFFNLL